MAGYECELVNPLPDRLLCNICHLPSRDPYLSVCCGHLICRICLENFGRFATAGNVCPVCRCEDFLRFLIRQMIKRSGLFACIVLIR